MLDIDPLALVLLGCAFAFALGFWFSDLTVAGWRREREGDLGDDA